MVRVIFSSCHAGAKQDDNQLISDSVLILEIYYCLEIRI